MFYVFVPVHFLTTADLNVVESPKVRQRESRPHADALCMSNAVGINAINSSMEPKDEKQQQVLRKTSYPFVLGEPSFHSQPLDHISPAHIAPPQSKYTPSRIVSFRLYHYNMLNYEWQVLGCSLAIHVRPSAKAA